jgi:hypothetical protein
MGKWLMFLSNTSFQTSGNNLPSEKASYHRRLGTYASIMRVNFSFTHMIKGQITKNKGDKLHE